MTEHDTGISELVSVLKTFDQGLYKNERRTEDIYGLSLLQNLLHGYPYLSFTTSAMRPYCIAHMVNDVLVNQRQQIIEFGSGISTLLLARLIKANQLTTTLISVDHNSSWAQLVTNWLKREGLDKTVRVVYAPLVQCNLALEDNHWYDTELLTEVLTDKRFDMVIVDGPPAHDIPRKFSRFPALPFMIDRLENKFSVYLDDANRAGEQEIIKRWGKEYGLNFTVTGRSTAYHYTGEAFFTEPIAFF